jgi:transposase
VPEVRRLLVALGEPAEGWSVRLAWSRFRRRHQAIARRCHIKRRGRGLAEGVAGAEPAKQPVGQTPARRWRELSGATWQRIQPLLPPQKPPRGRPGYDQRTLLAGMLWVMSAGATWREVPERFAPWHTVYACYQRWRKAGIWEQIVAVLAEGELKSNIDP